MKRVNMFQASDNTVFLSEDECAEYEANLQTQCEIGEYADEIGLSKGNRTRMINAVSAFLAWKQAKMNEQINPPQDAQEPGLSAI